jgi:hypothetical protein
VHAVDAAFAGHFNEQFILIKAAESPIVRGYVFFDAVDWIIANI